MISNTTLHKWSKQNLNGAKEASFGPTTQEDKQWLQNEKKKLNVHEQDIHKQVCDELEKDFANGYKSIHSTIHLT